MPRWQCPMYKVTLIFICGFLQKWLAHFLLIRNNEKNYLNLTLFDWQNNIILYQIKVSNGTVVNGALQSLHGQSLEITKWKYKMLWNKYGNKILFIRINSLTNPNLLNFYMYKWCIKPLKLLSQPIPYHRGELLRPPPKKKNRLFFGGGAFF